MITGNEPEPPPAGLCVRQVQVLLVWLAAGLLALGCAVVLADLVFPEPTGWRVPLMLAVLAAAAWAAARSVARRRGADAARRPATLPADLYDSRLAGSTVNGATGGVGSYQSG